jgi:hypothetical protein
MVFWSSFDATKVWDVSFGTARDVHPWELRWDSGLPDEDRDGLTGKVPSWWM